MTLLLGSLQQGLVYALLGMGVYISFRVLGLPDLTTDGSFIFGMAVSAMLAIAGHPVLGLAGSLLAGALAGTVTGLLQTKAEIAPILAGILTMFGLYTVNLAVQGNAPNLSLLGQETVFTLFARLPWVGADGAKTLFPLLLCLLALVGLVWFLHTHAGLCLRATGSNESMVRASSINVDRTKVGGLALANALIALSGGVLAQYQGFSDVTSGSGIVVIGLASVIIGEVLFGRRSVNVGLLSAGVGAMLYRAVIALVLRYSIFPASALKLISAAIVALALSLPALRRNLTQRRMRGEARRDA